MTFSLTKAFLPASLLAAGLLASSVAKAADVPVMEADNGFSAMETGCVDLKTEGGMETCARAIGKDTQAAVRIMVDAMLHDPAMPSHYGYENPTERQVKHHLAATKIPSMTSPYIALTAANIQNACDLRLKAQNDFMNAQAGKFNSDAFVKAASYSLNCLGVGKELHSSSTGVDSLAQDIMDVMDAAAKGENPKKADGPKGINFG